jgi:hypothetical protein
MLYTIIFAAVIMNFVCLTEAADRNSLRPYARLSDEELISQIVREEFSYLHRLRQWENQDMGCPGCEVRLFECRTCATYCCCCCCPFLAAASYCAGGIGLNALPIAITGALCGLQVFQTLTMPAEPDSFQRLRQGATELLLRTYEREHTS